MQQRLIFHLTRFAVPTSSLWTAFAHTYEEVDLLEEWLETMDAGEPNREAGFNAWIREGSPSRQQRLRDAQQRAHVRADMRAYLRDE